MVFHPVEFKMENIIVLPNTNGTINLQFLSNRMEKPLFCSQRQCIHLQSFFLLSGLKLRNSQNTRASTFFEGETFFGRAVMSPFFSLVLRNDKSVEWSWQKQKLNNHFEAKKFLFCFYFVSLRKQPMKITNPYRSKSFELAVFFEGNT